MFMLEIVLTSGVINPGDLPRLIEVVESVLPAGGSEGVVLSGRMPVWAFSALTHLYHPRPWVGTFDPRLGGGVVVASHTAGVTVGDVVPTDGAEIVRVEFGS